MDPDPSSLLFSNYNPALGFAGIIILFFVYALLSGVEMAFFSLSPKYINDLEEKSPKTARKISELLEKPKKLLVTVVITNTVISIFIIILFFNLTQTFFTPLYPWVAFILKIIIITFLLLFSGQVLPKMYASGNNTRFLKIITYPLWIINKLLSPVSIPMREAILFIAKKFKNPKPPFAVSHLSQNMDITDYRETGVEEQKLLEGIVTFGNTDVKQIMCPRIDIFALDNTEDFKTILPKIVEKGFSRIPVYRENIDTIIGILFIKDLLPYISKPDFNWLSLIRQPFFVPENKKLDKLLQEFRAMKNHLAIVVDEYGGTSGLVSMEDILEEIVGDISDEFDDEDIIYSKIDESCFLFEGKISLKDFYKISNVDEVVFENARGEAETLAGFLLEVLGDFPEKGDKINFKDITFTIESVDKRRIKQIKVTTS